MDEQTLEPCPFCGATDAFSERADFSSSYVICNNCLARGPVQCQDSDEEEEPGQASAITAWNRRAAHSVIAVKVAERTVNYEELAILHGQQVTVTFKDSADAFSLFNELQARGDLAALAPYPERRSEP